jgi:hypothetical protein
MGMPEKLGAMHMTPTVKLLLLALRGYLILIVMLVFLSVLHKGGLFAHYHLPSGWIPASHFLEESPVSFF